MQRFSKKKGKLEEQSGKINPDLIAFSLYLPELKKVEQDYAKM